MQLTRVIRRLRPRQLSLAGVTLTLVAVGACNDEAIVYPNRNQMAPAGGAAGTSGGAGEAGAPEQGGTSGGGTGGSGNSAGSLISLGGNDGYVDDGGASGAGGAAPLDQCGDHVVQPPEECDDGNKISGDGCSAQCKSSCEVCEQKVCPIYDFFADTTSAFDECYRDMSLIKTGPAANAKRADVCRTLVDCIRRERCAQTKGPTIKIQACWCAADWNAPGASTQCAVDPDPANPTDPTKFIPGKCAQEFQDASEVDTKAQVLGTINATSKADGIASRLMQLCDTRNCTEECVPEYLGHEAIATITGDILVQPNMAGESPLGDVVADAQRALAGADVAFVAPSFIITADFVPDLLFAPTPDRGADAPGRVLWSEAMHVHAGYGSSKPAGNDGFDNLDGSLYKTTFTGQQLYDALNQQFNGSMLYVSGLSYTYDAAQPIDARVLEVRKDNVPIDKAAHYTVALTLFLSGKLGSTGIPALTAGTNPTLVAGADLYAMLGEYLKQLPQPVSPPTLNRITRMN